MSEKNKRQALGRGLEALLGGEGLGESFPIESIEVLPQRDAAASTASGKKAESAVVGSIASVAINLIDPNPKQPRRQFDEKSLQELSASIKQVGILEPLTVSKQGNRYQLIAGERRLRASKMAGLKEVPVYVRMVTNEKDLLEMGLVENIQREDLNAMDIALSYQALMEAYQYSQDEVGKRVGKDRSTVTNYIRLLKLPAEVQMALSKNDISMGHARALLSEEQPEKQVEWVRRIKDKGLSVRAVEEGLRQEKKEGKPASRKGGDAKPKPAPKLPTWCEEACARLSKKTDSSVEVHKQRGWKGSLQIRFESEEALQEILKKLNA